jgi:hypothetical protein
VGSEVPSPTSPPTTKPTPSLARRMIALKETTPAPRSPPTLSSFEAGLLVGVYTGRDGRAELLNREFDNDPRWQDDEATQNWRNSLTASKPIKSNEEIELDVTNQDAVNKAYAEQVRVSRDR